MLIDLQLHTNYSDGYLSPAELVQFINKQGVKIAALTDHNTVGGLELFKKECAKHNIKAIPGIELYVKLKNKHFNLLWYNFLEHDPRLHALLRETHLRRRANVRRALNILEKKGLDLDVEKILDHFNRYIPINRLVDFVWEKPKNQRLIKKELNNKNPREEDIIKFYFKNKNKAFLRESYISLDRIIKLKNEIGGQLILNHPAKSNHAGKEFLVEIKRLGLDGIEILSPHHSLGAIMYLQHMARELDFVATGGSDFHRFEGANFKLQHSWQYFQIRKKLLRKIDKIIK